MGIERALPWLGAAFAAGLLLGAVPMGVLVARAFGLPDPRGYGSGNPGATNVLRSGHRLAAALTFLLDALKGAVPVLWFLGWGDLAAQCAGLGALMGHCYSPWLGLRGGKGVATLMGMVGALYWPVGIAAALTWLAAVGLSRISSVGGLAAAASAPLWFVVFERWEAVLAAALAALLVWVRHAPNLGRLLRGEEPRIGRRGGR